MNIATTQEDREDRHAFVNDYIRYMLWANTLQTVRDGNGDESLENYDAHTERELLTWDAIKTLVRDALAFRRDQYAHLAVVARVLPWGILGGLLALSRNGHRAGFLDLDGDEAQVLQAAARAFGESTLELINDRIEVM